MFNVSVATPVVPVAASADTGVRTMSSREIAELTGKTHANTMRDIRSMFEQLETSSDLMRSFEGTYTDTGGRNYPCYNLPRRECEILVTGYDVTRRAAVIDRWMALESGQVALPVSTGNPLLNALVESQRQIDAQAEQLALVDSRVDALERLQPIIIQVPENHKSLSDIKRDHAPWMSDAKIKASLDNKNWPYTTYTAVSSSGYANHNARAYQCVRGETLQFSLDDFFSRIRREAIQVTTYQWEHRHVPGRFTIG